MTPPQSAALRLAEAVREFTSKYPLLPKLGAPGVAKEWSEMTQALKAFDAAHPAPCLAPPPARRRLATSTVRVS
jgi:hypothetical protein